MLAEVPETALRRTLRRAAIGVLDMLLPRHCVVCERAMDAVEHGVVCGRCWTRVEALPPPRCERCGHPERPRPLFVSVERSCAWCALLPPYVRAVRSACWIGGTGSGAPIVHALKYGAWPNVAEGIAERLARLSWPADVVAERALLVPVPLAAARERERGFNQSALLARAVAARWGIPSLDLLERGRATRTQTRLTPDERLANVRGAFRATDGAPARLRGRHVVLVDDVVTTCATLNACAAALFGCGARIVSYVTFGRARTESDRS